METTTRSYEALDAEWRALVRSREAVDAARRVDHPRLARHYAARRGAITRQIKAVEAAIERVW